MYNTSRSYEENYFNGPDSNCLIEKKFPKLKYTDKPRYEFLGIPLHLPLGVAAGPLLNSSYVKVAIDAGFCLPVYKTVRSRAWKSNQMPNILSIVSGQKSLFANNNCEVTGILLQKEDYFKKMKSISNSFGVPSQAVQVWQKDFQSLSNFKNQNGFHICLSFQGTRDDNLNSKDAKKAFYKDIENTVKLAAECVSICGFSIIEMNLSCPNEDNAPLYKDIPSAIEAIKCAHRVLSEYNGNIKLVAKLGVLNSEETMQFLSECARVLDAISAINTISANIRTPDGRIALGSGSLTGGVCGSLIYEQGIAMTSLLAETREKLGIKNTELSIIGVGGVTSANEFQAYLSAGADIVQVATGMMWNLNLAAEIANSLRVPYVELEAFHDS